MIRYLAGEPAYKRGFANGAEPRPIQSASWVTRARKAYIVRVCSDSG